MRNISNSICSTILAVAICLVIAVLGCTAIQASNTNWTFGFTGSRIPFGSGNTRGTLTQDAGLAWNNTTKTLTATSVTSSGTSSLAVVNASDNVSITAAGKGLKIKEGSNARMGQSTLTNGKVKVTNTSITANTRIMLSIASTTFARAQALYCADQIASDGFDIYGTDRAGDSVTVVNWMLVEPAP